jgi:DUF4097 and DUF4098 domain-containing protein YvlB
MLRHVVLAASVGALLAGPVSTAEAHTRQASRNRPNEIAGQSIDTTFRMDKGGVVDLEAHFGEFIVTGTTGGNVRLRATAQSGRVRLRASATLATVRASWERGGPADVRYEVSVPPGVRVVMHTTSGRLSATGVKGDVEMENVSGDIELTDIAGLVSVETVSGRITAAGLAGGAQLETTSGDVTVTGAAGEIAIDNTSGTTILTDVRSSAVQVESVSGNVRFDGPIDPSGRYEFSSHSGNIRLTLPPNTGALLTLSTYTGSIDSEFPITLQRGSSGDKERELQFRLGSGSARLTAESFSGNIIITRGPARDRQE